MVMGRLDTYEGLWKNNDRGRGRDNGDDSGSGGGGGGDRVH